MDINQVIQGCQQNDRKYQRILVEQYSAWLMSISVRYAPDADSAKDALQEAWIRIFKHIQHFDSKKGKLESWMAKIVINTALQRYKKLRYDTEKSGLETLKEQSVIPDIYAQLGAEELMRLIAKLPEGYRIVFNLYVIEGYSHKEIADLLNIQVASSRSQLQRARKQLQKSSGTIRKLERTKKSIMNHKQFESHIKDEVSSHKVAVDTNELWDAIEPALPPKDKDRRLGLWFFLAIGLGAVLIGGLSYWGTETAPLAQLINENESLNENENTKIAYKKFAEKENLVGDTQLVDLMETKSNSENTKLVNTVKSNTQTVQANYLIGENTKDLFLNTRTKTHSKLAKQLDNNKAITKTTPLETKIRVLTTPNSLPSVWSMLTSEEADMKKKAKEESPPADQKGRKKWKHFVALNGNSNLVDRTIERNSTAVSEQMIDDYISLREMTESPKSSPGVSAYFGKEHKQSGLYVKTGFRYTKVNSVLKRNRIPKRLYGMKMVLSQIYINAEGDSTFVYEGNWVIEQTTQNIKHYNEFHLLDIPLIVGKRFSLSEQISFGIETGLAWNILFRPKGRLFNVNEQVVYVDESAYKTTTIGASFMGGIHWNYAITESVEITLAASYQNYLGSWMEKSAPVTQRYQVVGLQLGVVKGF